MDMLPEPIVIFIITCAICIPVALAGWLACRYEMQRKVVRIEKQRDRLAIANAELWSSLKSANSQILELHRKSPYPRR